MKCSVVRMRILGIALPKRELGRQAPQWGNVEVIETRSEDLNRSVRYARLSLALEKSREERLYDPVLLWMHDDRFVLTGFERIKGNHGVVDYAQSLLCCVNA